MTELETFSQAEEFVLSIPRFTIKNTPEETNAFYSYLGRPGEKQKIIHVAGTNGKGSVCAYLSAICRKLNYKVGLFTSPHLESITERFCVNGCNMGEDEFLALTNKLRRSIEEYKISKPNYHPTFFEFLFFLGMLYFEEKDTQILVLETGLGGRLDATNVVENKSICVITSIGLDHCEYLGDTLPMIAREKAGIIKENISVVFADYDSSVSDVIVSYAKKTHSTAIPVDQKQILKLKFHEKYIDFSFLSRYDEYVDVSVPTIASYQALNSLLAIRAAEQLFSQGVLVTDAGNMDKEFFYECIISALKTTIWEGRMEEVYTDFYVDGAHNEDGMRAFTDSLNKTKEQDSLIIFGVNQDKDYRKMIEVLVQNCSIQEVVVTTIRGTRAADAKELGRVFSSYNIPKVTIIQNVSEAVTYCRSKQRLHQKIFALGSLYLVGEIKELTHEGGRL